MGKAVLFATSVFLILLIMVVFSDLFSVQAQQKEMDQLDTFLTKKVSIARGFTPEVEFEVANYLSNSSLDYNSIDFSGTTIGTVEWGETVRIHYNVQQSLIQRGLEFMGIEPIRHPPREFYIVATGRGPDYE